MCPAITCHPLVGFHSSDRSQLKCVELALMHNLAVVPATHQLGSEELHGCCAEIDKDCAWAFRGRNVYSSFMINEEEIVLADGPVWRWPVEQIYCVASAAATSLGRPAGLWETHNPVSISLSSFTGEPGAFSACCTCCTHQHDLVSAFWVLRWCLTCRNWQWVLNCVLSLILFTGLPVMLM